MKQIAIARWRDKKNEQRVKEDGAAVVIRRLRLRMLRKAFDLYLSGVNDLKKDVNDEQRCI